MTNPEVIIEVINGDRKTEDLTPAQVDYYKRVRVTYDLLCEGNPTKYVHGALEREFGLSRTQAWRTIRETELIFSKMQHVDKAVHRHIASEMAKKAFYKAELLNDARGMTMATQAFIKALGLDQEDPDLPDFDKIRPNTIIILPPTNAPQLDQVKGGLIDLNRAPKPVTIDIPHEELDAATGA